MPSSWDTAQERKLLLCIIEITNPKPPSWEEVSSKMGAGYSKEACRQHYQKIKKESAKNAGPSTPTTTPTKAATNAKTPKSTKSTKSSGTKRKHAESIDASKQDGDEVGAYTNAIGNSDGSPKKIKTDLAHRLGEIIKTEEKLADGSLDLVQDSLYE